MQAAGRNLANVYGVWRGGIARALLRSMENEALVPLSDPQTQAIIDAAVDVHRKMGRGFLEAVYPECLAIEFHRRRIPFVREVRLPVHYDGIMLPVPFRADFVCFNEVLIEVKALAVVTTREHAQVMSYLRASGLRRALLLNFGADFLATKRFVWGLPERPDPLHCP